MLIILCPDIYYSSRIRIFYNLTKNILSNKNIRRIIKVLLEFSKNGINEKIYTKKRNILP